MFLFIINQIINDNNCIGFNKLLNVWKKINIKLFSLARKRSKIRDFGQKEFFPLVLLYLLNFLQIVQIYSINIVVLDQLNKQ